MLTRFEYSVDLPEGAGIPNLGWILLAFFVGNSLDTSCLNGKEDVSEPAIHAARNQNTFLINGPGFDIFDTLLSSWNGL